MYPILLEFGPITVFSLWLFIAIGFVVGSLVFVRSAKRSRLRLSILFDHGLLLFFWTLLISRLTFIIFHLDLYFYQFKFSSLWEILAIWDKGLSFWGAILAWAFGIWFLSRKREENPMKVFDVMAGALLIGVFFGDIGAFLDGINYGTPTGLPWGMVFLSANVKYISPIHPTQLYGAIYTLAIALFLTVLLKKLKGRLSGFVTEAAIFLFGIFKFMEEFARGDETIKIFSVRLPQIAAAAAVIFSGYLIYKRYTNRAGGDPQYVLKNFFKNVLKAKHGQYPEATAAGKEVSPGNQSI